MTTKLDYNLKWEEYFRLSEESPSGLVKIKNYQGRDIAPYFVGTRLLNKDKSPLCWIIRFKNKGYVIHRIVWVLTYGSIDALLVIDHLDGNPFNNTITNLALKTQKNNTRNACKRIDNTTGTTGVMFFDDKQGNRYYQAQWYEINGIRRSKSFPIIKLGEETAKELAIAYREQQVQRLISEGADYTDRHGN